MTGKKKRHPGPPRAKRNYGNNTSSSKKQQPPKKTQPAISSAETRDEPGVEQRLRHSDEERKHQQRVLDLFRNAFAGALTSSTLTTTLQSVKQALYERDFARAFGDPEHLAVYAARWSPTRALCYASVLEGIQEHLDQLLPLPLDGTDSDDGDDDENNEEPTPTTHGDNTQTLKLVSIGGGAAEVVALGAFLSKQPSLSGSMTLLDSGPWATVVSQLTTAITTPPPLSKYASEAIKLTNAALVPPDHFTTTFLHQDVLSLSKTALTTLTGTTPLLITILFTLNELFTAGGIGKTTAFLLNLTAALPFGSLLLVVDSPGSYSEASIGKEAKRYPMQWLLDRIMLGTRTEPVNGRRWRKVDAQESVWFRLASGGLDYPIPLEDMRYQMHLYKAEDASLEEESEDDD